MKGRELDRFDDLTDRNLIISSIKELNSGLIIYEVKYTDEEFSMSNSTDNRIPFDFYSFELEKVYAEGGDIKNLSEESKKAKANAKYYNESYVVYSEDGKAINIAKETWDELSSEAREGRVLVETHLSSYDKNRSNTSYEEGGKIKVGDVVANTETRTIGVVRDVFEDDGDIRTDADGVVYARNLEHYSKIKHKDYQIAPSTKREIGSKYAEGGKTIYSDAHLKIVRLEDGKYYQEVTINKTNQDGVREPIVEYVEVSKKDIPSYADGGNISYDVSDLLMG